MIQIILLFVLQRPLLNLVIALSCTMTLVVGCAASKRSVSPTMQRPRAESRPTGIDIPRVPSAAPASRADEDGYVLICLVTGHGAEPDVGDAAQRRRAAIQAAIVDALRHAAEVRDDFMPVENGVRSVALSPQLMLRSTEHGSRMTLEHNDRGRVHRIEVVGGRLTHPPLRGDLMQQLLAEANDEVRLVHTGPTSDFSSYQATLACYRSVTNAATVTSPDATADQATPTANPPITTRRTNPTPAPQQPIHVPEP